jgi:hypothetical protein
LDAEDSEELARFIGVGRATSSPSRELDAALLARAEEDAEAAMRFACSAIAAEFKFNLGAIRLRWLQ